MSAESELSVTEDVWMQMLALLAAVTGVFTAADLWPKLIKPPAEPLAAVAAPAAPSPAPPRPRAPGEALIVNGTGGGPYYKTIAQALAAASEGSTILIQPGVYDQGVVIDRSITLVGGGTKPSDVTLTSSDAPVTLTLASGRVFIKNLVVSSPKDTEFAASLQIDGGSAVLEQVSIAASRAGVRVRSGQLDANDSFFEAGRGIVLEGRGRASLLRTSVTAGSTGIAILGMGELRVESSELRAGGSAIEAGQFAKVRLSEVSITGCGGAGIAARSGAELNISRSKITDNKGCGVSVDGASVVLDNVLFARERCGVGFLGAGSLESVRSEYSKLELGPLAIKPGRERDVVVKGSGNVGLDIPERK
ncbi:MAG: right-handed parallel beta-helix repeat-containing protein [Elusimicrobia bacterium]|nr:right-handed parallel beta-helix repeat-containing protein [Elusimicrobiota bacterium]